MSKIEVKPISRKSDLVTQELEKEILIYDLLIDKAFSLNETSSLIWNLCNGQNSVSDISASLSIKLNSRVSENLVWLALEQMKKQNLLVNAEEIAVDFGGLSRRDVIRKIGFASLVSLPVISSLLAPTSISAASSCFGNNNLNQSPDGCSCDSASDCINNCCSSAPRTCVTGGTKTPGTSCIAGCECQSGSCPNTAPRQCA